MVGETKRAYCPFPRGLVLAAYISVALMCSPVSAQPENDVTGDPQHSAGPSTMSLEDAVEQFNQIRLKNDIARQQPALTADEVVAAIYWAIERDEFESAELMRVYKQIASSRTIPANAAFKLRTTTRSLDGYDFDYWWIVLETSAPGDQVEYLFTVRRRMLNAQRAITSTEPQPFVPRPNKLVGPDWDQKGKLLFEHFRSEGFLDGDDSPEFAIPVVLIQPVTNDDLLLVSQVTDLQRLSISHGNVAGEGLRYLQTLTKLRSLELSHNPISDEDLVHLLPLKTLESLNLQYTNVTDKGLMKLKGLPHLASLHLRLPDPGITRAGMKELGKALPKLKILFITH